MPGEASPFSDPANAVTPGPTEYSVYCEQLTPNHPRLGLLPRALLSAG